MPVLEIYGDIGEDFWEPQNSITGKTVAAWLRENAKGADEITVRINSYGGVVSDGVAIYNLLMQHKARVVCVVDGFALSAASVIAMAGDEIQMLPGTMLMIHNASGMAWGTAADLEATAKALRAMSAASAKIYADRAEKSEEECAALMDAETWFKADEALAAGFCDKVLEGKKKKRMPDMPGMSSAPKSAWVDTYRNVPQSMQAAMSSVARKPKAATMMPTAYALGDRVSVRAGIAHDLSHTEGVVSIIHAGPALGITFDGMDMIHKWYVPDEVTASGSKPESDKSMKRSAQRHAPPQSAPPAFNKSRQPSAARSPFGELAGRQFARLGDR